MTASLAMVTQRFLALAAIALAAAGLALLLMWLVRVDFLLWLVAANQWLADVVIYRLGYWGVFALMFIESSFVPFPSEIIIPPAANLARRLPDWNLASVIVLGTAGSLAGALFNYAVALYLGRPLLLKIIDRFGDYMRISRREYDKAEAMFQRHGAISTLAGRLIPGIRQVISLPAGLARMNLALFCLLTALGAGVWVAVLAWLGYWFGGNAEQLAGKLQAYSYGIVAAAVLLVAAYLWVQLKRAKR